MSMKNVLKWIGIGCGGLFGLFVVLVIVTSIIIGLSGGNETGAPAPAAPATPPDRSSSSPSARFGDGTWVVGSEISPGSYQAPGGFLCYWERLSGFSGGFNEIIANGGVEGGRQIVTIQTSDAGFKTNGCGEWSRVR